jgi:hypothetical protein
LQISDFITDIIIIIIIIVIVFVVIILRIINGFGVLIYLLIFIYVLTVTDHKSANFAHK